MMAEMTCAGRGARVRFRLAVFGLLIATGLPGSGMTSVGEAGGASLLQPTAARPAALGEACSAEGGGVEVLGYNPAGLGVLTGGEFSAMYYGGFAGDSFVSALVGLPVRGGGVAAGLAYYSAGSVEWLDPTGGIIDVTAQRDLVGQIGAGFAVPRTGFSLGANGRLMRTELLEAMSDTRVAGDAGVRFEIPSGALALGASVQHLGGKLKLGDDSNSLPLTLRLGVRYRLSVGAAGSRFGTMESISSPEISAPDTPHMITTLAEYRARFGDGGAGFGLGAEYEYARLLALRGGFSSLNRGAAVRHDVFSCGIGVKVSRLQLDYAIEFLEFAQVHRFSVTVTSLSQ